MQTCESCKYFIDGDYSDTCQECIRGCNCTCDRTICDACKDLLWEKR